MPQLRANIPWCVQDHGYGRSGEPRDQAEVPTGPRPRACSGRVSPTVEDWPWFGLEPRFKAVTVSRVGPKSGPASRVTSNAPSLGWCIVGCDPKGHVSENRDQLSAEP